MTSFSEDEVEQLALKWLEGTRLDRCPRVEYRPLTHLSRTVSRGEVRIADEGSYRDNGD